MKKQAFIDEFFVEKGYDLAESFFDEDRPAKISPLPETYNLPEIWGALNALGIDPQKLWSHQADALDVINEGLSLALTTHTASGKSLVFFLSTLRTLIVYPNATAMTLYPMKALNSDQKGSWDKVARGAGMEGAVVKIDGSDPLESRAALFANARMLITTPDAAHSWFMHFLDDPKHQDFLANMMQLNIDETHLYDGYFGTSFSFLVRRMRTVRAILREQRGLPKDDGFQIVSASATMKNPQHFLHTLTATRKAGNLYDIGPDECGSPSQPRHIMRVRSPYKQIESRSLEIVAEILKRDPQAKIMLFIDSRANVEKKTRIINAALAEQAKDYPHLKFPALKDDETIFDRVFLPYRSGYTAEERTTIEEKFKDPNSNARVLITTSATEVGLDIPTVGYVVNAGVPEDETSIIQRSGRLRGGGLAIFVGNSKKGPHVIEKSFTEPPPDPILYRRHEGAQIQSAMCLVRELKAIGADPKDINPGRYCSWPQGFAGRYANIVDDVPVSEHLSSVLSAGKVNPHYAFPLRSSEGESVRVLAFNPATESQTTLEDMATSQYLREAYPGAVLLHCGRSYRIKGPVSQNRNVLARREKTINTTTPIIYSNASVFINKTSAAALRVHPDTGDFIGAVDVYVHETVTGFVEHIPGQKDQLHKYTNGNPYSQEPIQQRRWTQGFVLRFNELSGSDQSRLRNKLGKAFKEAVCRLRDLSTREVAVTTEAKRAQVGYTAFSKFYDGAIIIYDRSPSTMGMSQVLFKQFRAITKDIAANHSDPQIRELAAKLRVWDFGSQDADIPSLELAAKMHLPETPPEGFSVALYKGSVVKVSEGGDQPPYFAKILGAAVRDGQILYQVDEFTRTKQWAQASKASAVRKFVTGDKVQVDSDKFHLWGLVNVRGEYAPFSTYAEPPRLQPIAAAA